MEDFDEDQLRAAQREVVERHRSFLSEQGIEDPGTINDPRELNAAQVSLLIYVSTFAQCPHVVLSPRPARAFLEMRAVFCDACVEALRDPVAHPDEVGELMWHLDGLERVSPDVCDLCGQPSIYYTPITWVIPPLEVIGNICDGCAVALDDGTTVIHLQGRPSSRGN